MIFEQLNDNTGGGGGGGCTAGASAGDRAGPGANMSGEPGRDMGNNKCHSDAACGMQLGSADLECTTWQPCDMIDTPGSVRARDGAHAFAAMPAISVI